MKNIFYSMLISAMCMIGFSSCTETDYLKYDTSYNGIYFTTDELKYSFSVTSDTIHSLSLIHI